MIAKLFKLKDYKYYFQFTLNPYCMDIENNLQSIWKRIEVFKQLSYEIGRERVIWRYDPILTNEKYNVCFHKEIFAKVANALKDYTERRMLGFIDHYSYIKKEASKHNIKPLLKEEIEEMAISFKRTIDQYPGVEYMYD